MGISSAPSLKIRILKGQEQDQPQKQQQKQGPRRCRGGHLDMAASARQNCPKRCPGDLRDPGAPARAWRLFSSGSLRSPPQAQSRQARALRAVEPAVL